MNIADGTFDPAALGSAFSGNIGVAIAWIGAAVVAAIVGALTLVGIGKGLRWGLMLLRGYHREDGMWIHKNSGY